MAPAVRPATAPTAPVARMLKETALSPAAHLTCVNASRDEVDAVIRDYWEAGVRHIVALRGDPPGSLGGAYEPHPDGYANATELTAAIKAIAPFEVTVGLYPTDPSRKPSEEHDIDVLKAKIDAGATRAVTQFFFDTDAFLRFHDQGAAGGRHHPDPAGDHAGVELQGLAEDGRPVRHRIAGLAGDPVRTASIPIRKPRKLIAGSVAAETCARLEEEGFSDFHFLHPEPAPIWSTPSAACWACANRKMETA